MTRLSFRRSIVTAIAFLGTGLLGAALAEAAAKRGDTVTAWNRSADKARALAAFGVQSLRDAGRSGSRRGACSSGSGGRRGHGRGHRRRGTAPPMPACWRSMRCAGAECRGRLTGRVRLCSEVGI
ncbi:MAG: NAD(P)-binding domain-containing protein [Betaproteobacteria bacterium]